MPEPPRRSRRSLSPEPDQDAITPKQTGSWAIAIGRAKSLIIRLERAVGEFHPFSSKNLDRVKAEQCRRMIVELEEIVEKCEQWPNNRAQADIERPRIAGAGGRLDVLTAETDAICAVLGKTF